VLYTQINLIYYSFVMKTTPCDFHIYVPDTLNELQRNLYLLQINNIHRQKSQMFFMNNWPTCKFIKTGLHMFQLVVLQV